jgi:hypothetical protein
VPTEGVGVEPSTDSDNDGLFSDEIAQTNRIVVSYNDSDVLVRDIAWSTTELGSGDGDTELEAGETFLFTIDLRAVDPIPTAKTIMTLTISPYGTTTITLEKRVPTNISVSMVIP